MSRRTTVNLGRVISTHYTSFNSRRVLGLNVGWELCTNLCHFQTARTHWRRVRMALWQHSSQTHLSITHQSDLLVSTHQGRLFLLHLPLRNDPRLTGQRKLPVPPRSSSSCGPFRLCSVRLSESRHRLGMGASWFATTATLLLKVDSEISHRSPMAEDRDMRGKSNKHPKSSLSLAPTNAFEYKKRKPSQATGCAIWVVHVTYALGGVSRRGMQGADLEWLQSRGARFARSCSLLALQFLPLSKRLVGRQKMILGWSYPLIPKTIENRKRDCTWSCSMW